MTPVLDLFLPAVGRWFSATFDQPTRPQTEGWPHIAGGANTLVIAPTGSGKTLAAFLWGIDALYRAGRERRLDDRVYLVYVSPLKALNNDIEKNLRGPLAGIREAAAALGDPLPAIRVAVRTGDTLAPVRQAMVRRPPHVLITTPESLYLLLTSERFRPALRSVRTAIIDEVHALAANKRGAHLALTLERLEAVTDGPIQRIGCSATVRPAEVAADFLTGGRDCRIVDAGFDRSLDLEVVAPVPDLLTAVSETIWDAALQELAGWIGEHRTTLIFAQSRRMAERLARNLDERLPEGHVAAHHGSLSRRARLDAEERLQRGELRALVATSSLELGIDVGTIDLVVQLQSPRNVAAALQRVGRAGHALSRTSKGRILVTKGDELVEAAAVARAVRERMLDRLELPDAPLDVLAQQIVAAVAVEPWRMEDLHALFTRAAPYRGLGYENFVAVVRSLAEPLPAEVKGIAPRILWDRVNGRLHPRRASRLLALTSGGTIADAGLFDVYLADTDVKLGTLDEEFVSESLPGDVFLLGSRSWRIIKTKSDRVLVEDAAGTSPTVPFWKGEHPSRSADLGRLCGRLRRDATERLEDPTFADWARETCRLDPRAAAALRAWLTKARDLLDGMPSDRHITVESFPDALGGRHLAIHSVFGMRVNGAWGIALKEALRSRLGIVAEAGHSDDAILLSFAPGQRPPAPERVLSLVGPEDAEALVVRGLIGSPLFTTRFRYASVRALAIARMTRGQRTPAWLQRLQADALLEAVGGRPDFPLVAETLRECCQDALAVPRLVRVLEEIQDGELSTSVAHTTTPSPFLYPLLLAWDWAYLDAGHAEERRSDAVPTVKSLPPPRGPLDPTLVTALESELQHTQPAARARDANELAALLETLGDLDDLELADRVATDPVAAVGALAAEGRVIRVSFPGGRSAWVAADEQSRWQPISDATLPQIVTRCLRQRGPMTAAWLGSRYGMDAGRIQAALDPLVAEGTLASGQFLAGAPATEYVHRAVLEELQRRAARERRGRVSRLVAAEDFRAFLVRWQHVHPDRRLAGPEGILRVVSQVEGEDFPVRFWEQEILPARIEDYDPRDLDALGLGGQIVWTPFSSGPAGRVGVALREDLGWLRPLSDGAAELDDTAKNVLRHLELQGASFVQDLLRATGLPEHRLIAVLWDLFWKGVCTTDSFEPIRRAPRRPAQEAPPPLPPGRASGRAAGRRDTRPRGSGPLLLGRWSALRRETESSSADERSERRARLLLDRFGVVSRELCDGDWGTLRLVLIRLEYAGEIERGYFVEGLSGEQYALAEAITDLSAAPRRRERAVRQSLADPASLWGSVFPLLGVDGSRIPAPRLPQNLVVVRAGRALLLAESHGRALTPLQGFELSALPELITALVEPWQRPLAQRAVRRLEVATWDGGPVRRSPAAPALLEAGFFPDGDRLGFDGFPGPR